VGSTPTKLLTFGDPAVVTSPIRAKALVFHDPQSVRLLSQIERMASTAATALIIGETGTGKELVARHIHLCSGRNGPFVAVNCGALNESLAEAELFGHEQGAFTGAQQQREGWFEAANGGTLFLDEIGDLPLSLQVKLLRVLQEQQVVRLGSRKPIPLDIRVIAATNVPLEEAVAAGKFRQDLYYRLNVAQVRLPSLRERRGDILPLVKHFAEKYGRGLGREKVTFTPEAERALLFYDWPGNIRELENVVHYGLILSESQTIDLPHLRLSAMVHCGCQEELQLPLAPKNPEDLLTQGLKRLLESDVEAVFETVERLLISTAFEFTHGNQVRTARRLGISRNILRAQLKHFGLLTDKPAEMTGLAPTKGPDQSGQDFTLPTVRFRHASRYYTTGRPTYPPLLIERVADLIGLRYEDRVLDLGTGPGFLAFDFAAYASDITAIDPSPDMLEVARVNAAQTGAEILFIDGSASDLSPSFGQFRLVTIGRAFPWMDREDTLRRLDQLILPDGALVLFSDKIPDVPANAWAPAFRQIRAKYASMDETRVEIRAAAQSNESFLFASPFSAVERLCVSERRATPIERFVDRILSYGSTWTRADDRRVQAVEEEVRAALTPYAIDGIIHEVIEGEAIVARRAG